MRILLANDDGFDAPGLQALAHALKSAGHELRIAAPEDEQSGKSHALTMLWPIFHRPVKTELVADPEHARKVAGTPVDCVKLALLGLWPDWPELVISGINAGYNTGVDVHYSGTVGAAMEGAVYGYFSIAVSIRYDRKRPIDFAHAATLFARDLLPVLWEWRHHGLCWNVNFPGPTPESPDVVVVPLRDIPFGDNFQPGVDPRGRSFFWPVRSFHGEIFGQGPRDLPESEGDYSHLVEDRVTITPLMHNLTNREALDAVPEHARRFKIGE